ncbi:MAG: exo-alpha-sialidase [Verrucomicrobia bacterium]|nr:exo-alpha-sialidase [Verrucomicrobiota bacterium]
MNENDYDAMYTCRSRDDGRSWSKPVSTGLRGVDPRLLLLSNGLILCAYGVKEYEGNRRERRLMLNSDAGRTWSHHVIVFAGYGGSYPDAIEFEPNKILYVWNVDGFKKPGQTTRPRNYLRLATVTLRRIESQSSMAPLPIVK